MRWIGASVIRSIWRSTALARRDQRDRLARASGAAGAADPVDIALGVERDVVVDDVRDVLDVQPARRDVGRDQDVDLAERKRPITRSRWTWVRSPCSVSTG